MTQRLELVRSQNQGQVSADSQAIIALLVQQFALTFAPEASVEALLNSDD